MVIVPIPRGNWQETVLPKREGDPGGARPARACACMLDDRDANTPGWKFAEWEMRGVPLRLEIGPKDIEKSQVVAGAPRHAREEHASRWTGCRARSTRCSTRSRTSLFARALKFREEHTTRADTYDEFKQLMEGRPGFVIAAWCGSAECEAQIKPRRRPRSAISRLRPPTSTGTV